MFTRLQPMASYESPSRAFTLVKFSYVTTASLAGPFPWTHLPEQSNLLATFEDVVLTTDNGFTQSRTILKIVQDRHVIEKVFLNELAGQAAADKNRAHQIPLQDMDRHCAILVKKPVIALRYKLPSGLNRRIQMTFSQENGYDEVLNTLKETGVYVKSKSDLPQETAHHSLYRPSTASTNTTYQSGTTGASSSTNETAYSTNTGPLVPQYGLLHQQRPFSSSEPSNATLVPQSRMFPRPTLTTSIIPGPSIPESIISRPNGWANQTTVTPFGPLIAYRGDSNFVHYTPSLPTFPRPSQPHSSEEKDSLPRSLFSNGSGTQHLDLRMTLAELNQLEPPPKRKLPFTDSPELDENQSREKAVEPAVKRIRSKRTTAPNESKSYNLREKEEELDSDRGGSSLAPLNEPAAAKKTRKQTQVKATKNTAALGQDGNSKRKAAVKKDHPPTNAPRKRTMKVSASKNPETEVDAPKSKSLRARPPPKKEPSNKAALAKKPSLKSVSKEAFPTYASIGTQTESPQSKKTPVYTSRATQTQSPTMGGNVIYRSRSTQTSTPEQVTPELPLQQRPASAILSPNAVASIETPSRTERRRAPPVNKFTRPREVVNRFTPHPHLAAIQRRRASATGSSPLRRARPL